MKRFHSMSERTKHFLSGAAFGKIRKAMTGLLISLAYIIYLSMLEPMDPAFELPW